MIEFIRVLCWIIVGAALMVIGQHIYHEVRQVTDCKLQVMT
jgi:hypothetical protein